jgi:hypothetical protein
MHYTGSPAAVAPAEANTAAARLLLRGVSRAHDVHCTSGGHSFRQDDKKEAALQVCGALSPLARKQESIVVLIAS